LCHGCQDKIFKSKTSIPKGFTICSDCNSQGVKYCGSSESNCNLMDTCKNVYYCTFKIILCELC